MPPSKRRLYTDALASLEQGAAISPRITPFTKIEKTPTTKYRAPRLIQARQPKFNIKYGCFIKPLEKYNSKLGANKNIFGKGNYDSVASKYLHHKYLYKTEGDHSTFDAHVTKEMLKLTHKHYLACYNNNSELRSLSKQTINNYAKTRDGIKYKFKGSRMSGDVDTSYGNCLINYAILRDALERLNINDHEIMVQGDDFIIFSNVPIDHIHLAKLLLQYNMETETKPSVSSNERVEFCKTRPVVTAAGHVTMMPDPERLINRFGMTHQTVGSYKDYLLQLLYCYSQAFNNTAIGLRFKKIYEKIIKRYKIEPKKIKKIQKMRSLDRDLRWVLSHQQKNIPCLSYQWTPSQLTAYPYLFFRCERDLRRLDNKIDYIFSSSLDYSTKTQSSRATSLYLVSHDTETWHLIR
jgi:hypothetical protein